MKKLLVVALMVGSLNAMALKAGVASPLVGTKVAAKVAFVSVAQAKELIAAKFGNRRVEFVSQVGANLFQAKIYSLKGDFFEIYNLKTDLISGKAALINSSLLKSEKVGANIISY